MTIRKDPELHEFYQRVYQRHPKKVAARKAIVAVARKLTTRIYAVLKEQRPFVLRAGSSTPLTTEETAGLRERLYGQQNEQPRQVGTGRFVLETENPGFRFVTQAEEWLDARDRIVVLGTYSGTYKSTSKHVRAQFEHIWSMREGRVVRFQQYTDTKQFADTVAR